MRKKFGVKLVLVFLFFIFAGACNDAAVSDSDVLTSKKSPKPELKFVSWSVYHTPWHLAATEENLYVSSNAFAVMDVSNKKNPVELSCLRPLEKGWPRDVAVVGNHAYVAWEKRGIRVLDTSDKKNPKIITNEFNKQYNHLKLKINYPYLFTVGFSRPKSEGQLFMIDISKPENIKIAGGFDLGEFGMCRKYLPHDFVVDGKYLYLTFGPNIVDGIARLYVLDISKPSNMRNIETIELGKVKKARDKWTHPHLEVDKRGDYVYVTGPFIDEPISDIKIIDASEPANLSIIKGWNGYIKAADIEIQGDFAYITDYDNHLYIVDLSHPTKPRNRGHVRVPFAYKKDYKVTVCGNYAYMNNWDAHSIYVVDVSNPDYPCVINQIRFGHDTCDVSVSGNRACVSLWDWEQFFVVDVSKPKTPEVVSRIDVLGAGWGVDAKGDYAYVAMGAKNFYGQTGGLVIFDISNSQSPEKIGYSAPDANTHDVQVYVDTGEKRAYVAIGEPSLTAYGEGGYGEHKSETPGMRIVDVSDPHNPKQIGRYKMDTQGRGVHKAGNYVFLAAREGGLHIIDVWDPANPRQAGLWDPSDEIARAVCGKRNFAAVVYGNSLKILDIKNPAEPKELSEYIFNEPCNDVVASGKYLFVVTQNGLRVIDVTSPSNPIQVACEVGVFSRPCTHVEVHGSYIYVACHNGGVYIYKFNIGEE